MGKIFLNFGLILIVTVALAALTNCDGLLSSHYTVHIVLDRATGLEENSEVKANDLLVGRVAGIKLHPKGVVVEANIKNEAQLTKGTTAQVITADLLGSRPYLSLETNPNSNEFLANNDTIYALNSSGFLINTVAKEILEKIKTEGKATLDSLRKMNPMIDTLFNKKTWQSFLDSLSNIKNIDPALDSLRNALNNAGDAIRKEMDKIGN